MAEQAGLRRTDRDGIAWLEMETGPQNALTAPLRAALWQAVEAAEADAAIDGLVLAALGRSFPSGFHPDDFADTPAQPSLSDLCNRIEACTKPVVAALHGAALGAGLQLALAAHGRVALATTRLGCPEVNLGLLPGAGGTQRLPRLIGAEQALRLMLTGRPVPAAEALALGILDRVAEEGLAALAEAELRALLARGPAALPRGCNRREGMRDGLLYQRVIVAARSQLAQHRMPAPMRIVECVEAAQLLPFEAGCAFEAAAYADLLATAESAALRHIHFAEARAAQFAETRLQPRPAAAPLRRVGIFGATAADLALPLLQTGLEVMLVDPNRSQLVQGLERLAAMQEQAVAEGRLTPQRRDLDWARLGSALGAAGLADCGAVLLADAALMPEAIEVTPPGTLLAVMGRGAVAPQDRGGDILGFRPSGARLVELVVGPETRAEQVLLARALARGLGLPVLRSALPGGVPGRIMAAGRAAVAHLLMQGEAEEAVAAALAGFGFAGAALAGLIPQGVQPAGKPAPVAVPRVLSAMANEGARVLGAAVVESPREIDFAVVAAQGFPRWEGGPMYWADRRGLLILRRDLELWAEEAPEIWGIAPMLADLAGRGGRFADLG